MFPGNEEVPDVENPNATPADDNPFGSPVADDEFGFDMGEDDGTGFRIPKGEYPAVVTDITSGVSSNGNPMWTWVFALTSADKYGGREFKTWTVLGKSSEWKLREVLTAVGVMNSGKDAVRGKFKKADVIGKPVRLVMEDDEYKGVKQSKVNKVLPANQAAVDALKNRPNPAKGEDAPF